MQNPQGAACFEVVYQQAGLPDPTLPYRLVPNEPKSLTDSYTSHLRYPHNKRLHEHKATSKSGPKR